MVNLTVNGSKVSVDAPDDMPLLWVLRDILGMTGTKFGCGIAQCGACTVHVDSEATRSCVTPISQSPREDHDDRGSVAGLGPMPLQQRLAGHRSCAMRLLPIGPDHERGSAAARSIPQPTDEDIDAACREHLPLRNLCAYSRSHQARGEAGKRTVRPTMDHH